MRDLTGGGALGRAAGPNPWIRLPVLLWLGWLLVRLWGGTGETTIFAGIDLVFHEAGHIIFAPFGEFMAMAGGTLGQLLIPAAAGAALYRQGDRFGVAVVVIWLGINCFEIATYAGDALTRRLPLVSPTAASPVHDWTYLLAELGALRHTDTVAAAWRWAGRLLMAGGLLYGAALLRGMAAARRDGGPAGRAEWHRETMAGVEGRRERVNPMESVE